MKKASHRSLVLILAFAITLSCCYVSAFAASVPQWFYDRVIADYGNISGGDLSEPILKGDIASLTFEQFSSPTDPDYSAEFLASSPAAIPNDTPADKVKAYAWCWKKGIVRGDEKGWFGVERSITRAEQAAIDFTLIKLGYIIFEDDPTVTGTFSDVDPKVWYAEAIASIAKKKIMNGTGNGNFNPTGTITKYERFLHDTNTVGKTAKDTTVDTIKAMYTNVMGFSFTPVSVTSPQPDEDYIKPSYSLSYSLPLNSDSSYVQTLNGEITAWRVKFAPKNINPATDLTFKLDTSMLKPDFMEALLYVKTSIRCRIILELSIRCIDGVVRNFDTELIFYVPTSPYIEHLYPKVSVKDSPFVINPVGAKVISWESDNPNVLSVDQNGTCTPITPGTARITAYFEDGKSSDSATIIVEP